MAEQVEGFVEVHIEQHDELEKRDYPLGVVAGIAGNTHTLVTINGDLAYVRPLITVMIITIVIIRLLNTARSVHC